MFPRYHPGAPVSKKTVIVLGIDGYLGWATALHLSQAGHDVVGIDSLVRRRWDRECGTQSLIPIKSMPQRVTLWKRLTGLTIRWRPMDLCDARAVTELVQQIQPDAPIHFAEQRSAPFSMIDLPHATLTQVNNVVGTLNLLFALRDYAPQDRKSTRLNSSHRCISYAVFCLKKKKNKKTTYTTHY